MGHMPNHVAQTHCSVPGLIKNASHTIFIYENLLFANHLLLMQFHKYVKLHERSMISYF